MERRKDGVPARTGCTPRFDPKRCIMEDEIPTHPEDEDFTIEGGETLGEFFGDELIYSPG